MPDHKTVMFDARDVLQVLSKWAAGMSSWQDEPKGPYLSDIITAARTILAAAPTPAAQSAGQEAVAITDAEILGVWALHDLKPEPDSETILSFARDILAAPVNGGERETEAAQTEAYRKGVADGRLEAEQRLRAADAPQVGGQWSIEARSPDIAHIVDVTGKWISSCYKAEAAAIVAAHNAALSSPAKVDEFNKATKDQIAAVLLHSNERTLGQDVQLDAYLAGHDPAKVGGEFEFDYLGTSYTVHGRDDALRAFSSLYRRFIEVTAEASKVGGDEQDEIARIYNALPKGVVQPCGWLKFDDVQHFVNAARAALSADTERCEWCVPAGPWRRAFEYAALSADGGDRKDAERLDFMIEQQAWVQWTVRDGSIRQCQVYTQDEDENYHILSGEDRFFSTPREAIDAAIAAKAKGDEQ